VSEEFLFELLESIRWPAGLKCVRCGQSRVTRIKHIDGIRPIRSYRCHDCRYRYPVTAGTVFHDSRISLDKWFSAIVLICSSAGDMKIEEVQIALGVDYETAWTMTHRINIARRENPAFCLAIANGYTRISPGKGSPDLLL
jgi:transposase-like protein